MKFSTVAIVVVLSLAGFSGAMPAHEGNVPAAGSSHASSGTQTRSETNAERLSRGLPPMKPRSMQATRTEVKRQGPSGMRRRQEPSPGTGNQRRASIRTNKRDRYAGVYGA
ncbi:hypothetical protein HDZ31DRAFT_70012 [Schizophyllum fasciatum]